MEKLILLRYGEIHLKGKNRPYFEMLLKENLKKACQDYDVKITRTQGRYFVEGETLNNTGILNEVIKKVSRVFGLVSLSPVNCYDKDIDNIKHGCVETLNETMQKNNLEKCTFKVRVRRADKNFPVSSMDFARELGGYLLDNIKGITVDVHNPDYYVDVEIRDRTYISCDVIKCAGGMPVGCSGKATLLLSGGIDSPVAAYMIAKRGVSVHCVHFHSYPYTSEQAKNKVIDLAKILTNYCGPIKLDIVSFTDIQMQLIEKCPESQLTVLMRRAMMKIAERLAKRNNSSALITGESLGQVASQTIASLHCTNSAVKIPVLRPLIGFDKEEIIDIANKIETFETSILPYEDCCTLFLPKHPVTNPKLEKLEESETKLDLEALINAAIEDVETVKL